MVMILFIRNLSCVLVAALAAMYAVSANANGTPEVPVKEPQVAVTLTQAQLLQLQQILDVRLQTSAESWSSSGASSDADAASSANNSFTSIYPKQAPAISQGSFAINGCAVAGNAGGSGTGGAGFLGLGFTTEQCYDFMLAQAYGALGEPEAACDVLNTSRAGVRAAKRGVTLPECLPPQKQAEKPAVQNQTPVVVNVEAAKCETSDFVRKSDMASAVKNDRPSKPRSKKTVPSVDSCVAKP
jgi:hypothetical protein